MFVACDSRSCREGVIETKKSEIHDWSSNMAFDDYNDNGKSSSASSAADAYDAIDVSRPVSQTSLFAERAPDDVREIP